MNQLNTLSEATLSQVILQGDLSRLSPTQKVEYIVSLCQRVGLDPATQPFKLMTLNGKQIAYADRSCAAQLNKLHGLSHQITETQKDADSILMIDRCTGPDGRFTEEVGAVSLTGLRGEALANAIMKCRTKAMRRATLTHVGLGMLDETEVETVPGATVAPVPTLAHTQHEWTDEEVELANVQLKAVVDDMLTRGVEEERAMEAHDRARNAIGDPSVTPGTFLNRIAAMSERMIAKVAAD